MSKSQFMKLLQKKRANSNSAELDFANIQFEKDPWDAVLVPEEPDPSYYDTYEDYEAAMKRWALLLSNELPIIPPHASQLKDLIPIQTVVSGNDRDRVGGEDESGIHVSSRSNKYCSIL